MNACISQLATHGRVVEAFAASHQAMGLIHGDNNVISLVFYSFIYFIIAIFVDFLKKTYDLFYRFLYPFI